MRKIFTTNTRAEIEQELKNLIFKEDHGIIPKILDNYELNNLFPNILATKPSAPNDTGYIEVEPEN